MIHPSAGPSSAVAGGAGGAKKPLPGCGRAIRNWKIMHTMDLNYGNFSSGIL